MFPCSNNQFEKTQRIQNRAIRMAMEYMKSTPICVLTAESRVSLLKHRIKYLCYVFLLKLFSTNNNSTLKSIKTLQSTAEHSLYSHNYQKPLLLECYVETWHNEGLIYIRSTNTFNSPNNTYIIFLPIIQI